eukprot:4307027-Pyramimonas_sp.AAC.1
MTPTSPACAALRRLSTRSRPSTGLGPPQAGVDTRHRGGVGFQHQPGRVLRSCSAGDRQSAGCSPSRSA